MGSDRRGTLANLIAPVSYQGGKHRIAEAILDRIDLAHEPIFYDLCCGGGSIAVALVNRGYDPRRIVMVDRGPWGHFWDMVGDGTFDLATFAQHVAAIPDDPAAIRGHLQRLASGPLGAAWHHDLPILQAGSFGGKAIWTEAARWRTHGFRDYWLPTATSNRRSPVNPMMPMPATLHARVRAVAVALRGVTGACRDIHTLVPPHDAVCYLDPPYGGTTSYGHTCDAVAFARAAPCTVYVSEARALTPHATLIAGGRDKGGISGKRTSVASEEWLSVFTH